MHEDYDSPIALRILIGVACVIALAVLLCAGIATAVH